MKILVFQGMARLSLLSVIYDNLANMFLALNDIEPEYKGMEIETTIFNGEPKFCKHVLLTCFLNVDRKCLYSLDGTVDKAFLLGDKAFIGSFLRNCKHLMTNMTIQMVIVK
jgi:hypothetical protein